MKVVVTGAGGFIGHWLVKRLRAEGHWVHGVDVKLPEYEPTEADAFDLYDLRDPRKAARAVLEADEVYHLAANMGGIGFISSERAAVAYSNVLIDANVIHASYLAGVRRLFYASSACVYPAGLQDRPDVEMLRESDAIPADPEPGYGWEKLFAEQLLSYYHGEGMLQTRVARFHNIYGPLGTYQGGREKAPAALCRKIALASENEIEVWGDGQQTRSFTFVEDCVEGIVRIMRSEYPAPLNLGTSELVTIDQLANLIAQIAGKHIAIRHVDGPQGVRGRNSDNTEARRVLGWEPPTTLREGLVPTYRWIAEQVGALEGVA